MPRYGRKKKRSNRKSTKKSTNRKGAITQWPPRGKAVTIMPDSIRLKLKYGAIYTLSAINSYLFFRGNSVYDPEEAAGGGQPEGFDQWATLYKSYKVSSSGIRVNMIPGNSSNLAASTIVAVRPALDTSNHIAESSAAQPYGRSRILQNVYAKMKPITNFMTSRKIFGTQTDDTDYGALVSADPTNQWYWACTFQAADGSTSQTSMVYIELTYWVTFSQREDVVD